MYEYHWQNQIDQYLTQEGVNWEPYIEDWKTFAGYGPQERPYTPVAVINHHTASTAWYPKEKLTTKCNIYIDPSGKAWLMSAGYQFDSGYGDPHVLSAIEHGQTPPKPTDTTDADRILGNPWFIDIEVGHPGDGSVIPEVQRECLIKTNVALMRMNGWNPFINLIDHKWWTRRKIDVRWSREATGLPDTMEQIQLDVWEAMSYYPDVPENHPFYNDIMWLKDMRITMVPEGEEYGPKEPTTRGQMAAFLHRTYDAVLREVQ